MIALVLFLTLAADKEGAGYFPLPAKLKVKPEAIATKPFDLTIKKPEKLSLANGTSLYLVEDHAAPLVTVRALIDVGTHDDPAAKLGLTELLFEVMSSGGAGDKNADQLDDLLEQQAADLFASASDEYSSITLSLRAEDVDKLLPVFADVVMKPGLQKDRFDVAVNRVLENIRRRTDRPDAMASRALNKALFGPASLLGRESTAATLKAVKHDDLKALHAKGFGAKSISLLVTGDFSKQAVVDKLNALFGKWQGGPGLPDRDYGPAPKLERRVIFIPKQTPQVKIRIGGPGYKRLDPAEYPMRVVSTALGSFGVGRLYKEVRDERGLAYSAYAYVGSGPTTGVFIGGFDTKPESAEKAIEVALPILEGKDGPLNKGELATAVDMSVNSFAFRFDSAAKIAWERAVLDLLGFPDDYLDSFRAKMSAVNEASAAESRAKLVAPFQIVVVGPEGKVGDLSKFGPVTVIKDVEAWQ